MGDSEQLRLLISDNRHEFDRLVDEIHRVLGRRPAFAASLVQTAAMFACFHHTGWFASSELEAAVAELSCHLGRHVGTWAVPGDKRTLHVATQLYQTGGSTQLLALWTDGFDDKAHEIAVTQQATTEVPIKIRERLNERVRLTRLDLRPGSLLARAARLRSLASNAELVVLHTHPYDVVSSLAFANRMDLPNVVFVDNADHIFWLGVNSADCVMHLRFSGQQLACDRRGLPPSRSIVLNRPLKLNGHALPREKARRQWGVSQEDILVVTAADTSKFRDSNGYPLLDILASFLEQRPGICWFVAGADPDVEPWRTLAVRTSGRLKAVGILPDVSNLHSAADIYLDSFPFAGLTSLLESGAAGNPVVTFRGHSDSCAVFGSDSPGIDHLIYRPETAEELVAVLDQLAADQTLRLARGSAVASAVLDGHGTEGWRKSIEPLYTLSRPEDDLMPPSNELTALDLLVASVQSKSIYALGIDGLLISQLGLMPFKERIAHAVRLRSNANLHLTSLAPAWLLAWASSKKRLIFRQPSSRPTREVAPLL